MAGGSELQHEAIDHLLTAITSSVEVLALPEVFSLVEKANLPALSVALQLLDLYEEVAVLQRLAYKNKNQHRSSKHYQAVCQVLKVLQLFQHLQLPALLQQLHTAAQRTSLHEAPPAAHTASAPNKRVRRQLSQTQSSTPTPTEGPAAAGGGAPGAFSSGDLPVPGNTQRQALRLPSFQSGCLVLRRLLSGGQLLVDLHYIIMTAAQHLSGQLSRGYFMPFCLVAIAAVARIRVLSTAALLELLQAYNSLAQLLPLLPVAAAIHAASSSSVLGSADSTGLPQSLQLSWHGPIPALRYIEFDQEGPHSLQGQVEELRSTWCINTMAPAAPQDPYRGHSSSLAAAGPPVVLGQAGGMPGQAASQLLQGGAGPAGAADIGVAISREAFALQQDRRHPQQQQEQPRQQQQQQQQRQGHVPTISISVVEDKQRDMFAEGSAAQQVPGTVPLYSTVPGLGFSLGQQLKPASTTRPAAGPASGGVLGQSQQVPLTSLPLVAAGQPGAGAAAQASLAAVQLPSEDDQEFVSLYGARPTPAQQHQQTWQRQQQQEQQQVQPPQQPPAQLDSTRAAAAQAAKAQHTAPAQAPAVAPRSRGGLSVSAAMLAMQGGHSSDEEENNPAAAGLPASGAGAAPAPSGTFGRGLQHLNLNSSSSLVVEQPGQQQNLSSHAQVVQPPQQEQLPMGRCTAVGARQAVLTGVQAHGAATAAAQGPSPAAPTVSAVRLPAVDDPAGTTAPLLQAAKKNKHKKKVKQQQSQPGGKDMEGQADGAARDSILDMLLQGL